jgi:hypothetical protein
MRTIIVISLVGVILIYGAGSVWLATQWRAQGPMYRKSQERDGDITRERLEKEGLNLIAEKQRQAAIEESRITNNAKVQAAEILAAANKKAAEIRAIGEDTSRIYFLDPFLKAAGKAVALRQKRDGTMDADERRRIDLLISVYEETRDESRAALNKVSNGMINRVTDANRR